MNCDSINDCNSISLSREILSDFMPVWMLEIPQNKNIQRAKEFWFAEVKRLRKRLQEFSGIKITAEGLKRAIQKLNRRQAIFREFYELKKHNPPPINCRDSSLVMQTSFYDDIERWIDKTEKLCKEIKQLTIDYA